jgi:hypothetical protein
MSQVQGMDTPTVGWLLARPKLRHLSIRNVFWECVRLQISTQGTAECLNGKQLIRLHLQTCPEAPPGFSGRPDLLTASAFSQIRDVPNFHLHMTFDALDRFSHCIVAFQIIRNSGCIASRITAL